MKFIINYLSLNKIFLTFFLIFKFKIAICQIVVEEKFLPKIINETSGLEYYNGNFLTHNDSGGEEKLYEFSDIGNIIAEYKINGCGKNTDWEDIASDENNIYIANTGNNFGYRTDLEILILDKKDNFKCNGRIEIRYEKQNNYSRRSRHEYDSEGLIATDNNLVLFSKNRLSFTTELYFMPKTAGSYELESKAFYNAKSLITGADYQAENNLVALVGYNIKGEQFLYTIHKFFPEKLELTEFKKYKLPINKAQIEAIKIIDDETFWLTSEDEGNGYPRLFKIKL